MICRRMLYACILANALGIATLPSGASAAPAGVALIVSNSVYSSLAPLPACALSARTISVAFKDRGYDVTALSDGTVGQFDGAIVQLGEKLRATPGIPVVVYVCGYVAGQNGRAFLVPASAALERPADILSQGILAKTVVDVLANSGQRAALVVLEAVAIPNATGPMGLTALDRPDLPAGLGLLAATVAAGDPSRRLAAILIERLKTWPVQLADLVNGARQDPDGLVTAAITLVRVPTESYYVIGFAPPLPVKALAPEPAQIEIAAMSSAEPGPEPLPEPVPESLFKPVPKPLPEFLAGATVAELPSAPPPSIVSAPAEGKFPDEEQMTDGMRRTLQTKLAALGYYAGPVDGIFAAETRAAIRRLQHELQVPMTGRFTGEQAGKLMTVR